MDILVKNVDLPLLIDQRNFLVDLQQDLADNYMGNSLEGVICLLDNMLDTGEEQYCGIKKG